jgi:hypothetical protein
MNCETYCDIKLMSSIKPDRSNRNQRNLLAQVRIARDAGQNGRAKHHQQCHEVDGLRQPLALVHRVLEDDVVVHGHHQVPRHVVARHSLARAVLVPTSPPVDELGNLHECGFDVEARHAGNDPVGQRKRHSSRAGRRHEKHTGGVARLWADELLAPPTRD